MAATFTLSALNQTFRAWDGLPVLMVGDPYHPKQTVELCEVGGHGVGGVAVEAVAGVLWRRVVRGSLCPA